MLYNLKLNCLFFFYRSKQFTDYVYTDIYCKLSKCIGQTPCSYEHFVYSKAKWYRKTELSAECLPVEGVTGLSLFI